MLAKKTTKNQLTLPKKVLNLVDNTDYYQVEAENGRIVLTPVRLQSADGLRRKIEQLGITPKDVSDAVKWARNRGGDQ